MKILESGTLALGVFTISLQLTACNERDSDARNSLVASTNLALIPVANVSQPPVAAKVIDQLPVNNPDKDMQEVASLEAEGHNDEALKKLDSLVKANPQRLDAYIFRGQIFIKMNNWPAAQKEFDTVLNIDDENAPAKFNLSELKFMQKDYDNARLGFATLEGDRDYGDLASYKVFLCDLWAGHEDLAKKELDIFNLAGDNPSYYFSNIAWYTYHKQYESARTYLSSALRIYYPSKIYLYAYSLKKSGYLPLPPPVSQ